MHFAQNDISDILVFSVVYVQFNNIRALKAASYPQSEFV